MSREVDVSDPSKLSKDEAQYAFDRYMINEEQYLELMGKSATEDPSTTGTPEQGSDDSGEQFDPSAHDVQTVIAYLNDDSTDDDEFARVIAAEKDGKARKGILDTAE